MDAYFSYIAELSPIQNPFDNSLLNQSTISSHKSNKAVPGNHEVQSKSLPPTPPTHNILKSKHRSPRYVHVISSRSQALNQKTQTSSVERRNMSTADRYDRFVKDQQSTKQQHRYYKQNVATFSGDQIKTSVLATGLINNQFGIISYQITEYFMSSFSIDLLVQTTGQKWVVFVSISKVRYERFRSASGIE